MVARNIDVTMVTSNIDVTMVTRNIDVTMVTIDQCYIYSYNFGGGVVTELTAEVG